MKHLYDCSENESEFQNDQQGCSVLVIVHPMPHLLCNVKILYEFLGLHLGGGVGQVLRRYYFFEDKLPANERYSVAYTTAALGLYPYLCPFDP